MKRNNRRCLPSPGAMFLLAIIALASLAPPTVASAPAPFRCKYSVRDVAFVNVHGKPWRLVLIKPKGVTDSQWDRWNTTLKKKLERSNVGYVWVAPDSEQGIQLIETFELSASERTKSPGPWIVLMDPDDRPILVSDLDSDQPKSFETQLDELLDSPARKEIIDHVASALCVVVLVESGDTQKDKVARKVVSDAMATIQREMWMMEKPTDQGAYLVTIPARDHSQERWLLKTLGMASHSTPSVAIVYGQCRRLGDVLSGDEIDAKTLTRLMAICGQSCECDLDRRWLYGQQMVHRWSREAERRAEASLTFDPHSAFVVAEVQQIILKRNENDTPGGRVDLGPGLIIHDLPSSDESTDTATSPTPEPSNSRPTDPRSRLSGAGIDREKGARHQPPHTPADTGDRSHDPGVGTEEESLSPIPWGLFGVLVILLGGGILATQLRSHWKRSGND